MFLGDSIVLLTETKTMICLKDRVTDKWRHIHTHTKIFRSLAHFLANCSRHCWTRLSQEPDTILGLLHGQQGPNTWAIAVTFSGMLAGSWVWSRTMGLEGITSSVITSTPRPAVRIICFVLDIYTGTWIYWASLFSVCRNKTSLLEWFQDVDTSHCRVMEGILKWKSDCEHISLTDICFTTTAHKPLRC